MKLSSLFALMLPIILLITLAGCGNWCSCCKSKDTAPAQAKQTTHEASSAAPGATPVVVPGSHAPVATPGTQVSMPTPTAMPIMAPMPANTVPAIPDAPAAS